MVRIDTVEMKGDGTVMLNGKTLEELTRKEAEDLSVISKNVGFNVAYCAALAAKYIPRFEEIVAGYRIMPKDDPLLAAHVKRFGHQPLGAVAVEFYGKKE